MPKPMLFVSKSVGDGKLKKVFAGEEDAEVKDDPSKMRTFKSQNDLLTITTELFSRFCYNFANFLSLQQ